MSWEALFKHVDEHKLPWAKRATEHLEAKIDDNDKN